MLRKIDAWFYGIEQRIVKWKRSRTPEYRAGQRARCKQGLYLWQNPYQINSKSYYLWYEGWVSEHRS